jgi:hypothetical protein
LAIFETITDLDHKLGYLFIAMNYDHVKDEKKSFKGSSRYSTKFNWKQRKQQQSYKRVGKILQYFPCNESSERNYQAV